MGDPGCTGTRGPAQGCPRRGSAQTAHGKPHFLMPGVHLLSPQNCFSISEHLSSPHTHTKRSFAVISDYKDNHDWGGRGSRREETPPGIPPALTNETSCSRARAAVILQGRGPEPHAGLQPVRTLSGSALRGGHALQEPFFESLTLKLHPEGIAQVPNSLLNINRSQ